MKSTQIERVMNLIKRTGDRCVVMDQKSDEVFTIMRLSDYEDLLDADDWQRDEIENLSEKEMMDKVDRDIAYWRSLHDDENECDCCKDENCCAVNSEFEKPEPAQGGLAAGEEFDEEEINDDGIAEETFLSNEEPSPEEAILAEEEKDAHRVVKEEPLDDLPEEDSDRFLLEPV